MIVPDVGVILTSPTTWVFEEYVSHFGGAQALYDWLKGRCECDDPRCPQEAMQGRLNWWFEGDKERCGVFLQRLDSVKIEEITIHEILTDMGVVLEPLQSIDHLLRDTWERYGMRLVPRE